jgi:futalosine hydrolase
MRRRKRLRGLGPRILVITAVDAERAAIRRGLNVAGDPGPNPLADGERIVVATGGVGPAAAAAATAWLLTSAKLGGDPFDLAVSAGIAGGYAGRAEPGATVLATRSVAADLGAESPDGFLSVDELGFGPATVDADPMVLAQLGQALPAALLGEVLTVSTVTGTAVGAEALLARHPAALAEAMEGFGVASAAERAETAFAEIRTISNPIGPRDRSSWRINEALAALAAAAGGLAGWGAGGR